MLGYRPLVAGLLSLLAFPAAQVQGAAVDGNVEWDGVYSDTTTNFLTPQPVKVGDTTTLRLRVRASDLSAALVRVWLSGPEQEKRLSMSKTGTAGGFDTWAVSLAIPTGTTALYYRFELTDGADLDYFDAGAPADAWAVRGMSDSFRGDDYNFKVLIGFDTPSWSKQAVNYQIFPDRFYDGAPDNNVLLPDDCVWYLDYAPALAGTSQCSSYAVPATPSGYSKLCQVHTSWTDKPNQGPCDFFGGDLGGVEAKLGYLKDLQVTSIYLNPIFRSVSNHKYDTMDYDSVDPRFGGDEAADALTTAASQKGLRVVLDGVFNHGSDVGREYNGYQNYAYDNGVVTGVDAYPSTCGAWENAFLNKCTSAYSSWFKIWTGTDQYDVDRDGNKTEPAAHTCGWYGYEFMPDFDYKNVATSPDSDVRKWLYGGTQAGSLSVARTSTAGQWLTDAGMLTKGADGWRLDVPDNAGYFANSTAGDCTKVANDTSIWKGFRTASKTVSSDKLIVGEIWQDATTNQGMDFTGIFDGVMNYYYFAMPMSCYITGTGVHNDTGECVDAYAAIKLGSATAVDALDAHLARERRVYPAAFYQSSWNLLSSHDTARFVSRAGGDSNKLKTAILFQATLPGAPTLYYGDEVGLTGENNELGRGTLPWTTFDNANSSGSLLREYTRSLMCIRRSYPALQTGSFITLWTSNTDKTYGFGRWDSTDQVAVGINNDGVAHSVDLRVERLGLAEGARMVDVIGGQTYTVASGVVKLTLGARGGAILVAEARATSGRACMDRNDQPVADAGADVTIKEGTVATLNGTASYDPEGATMTYVWKDATGQVIANAPGTDIAGLTVGSYTYSLTVNDGVYSSSDSMVVTVTTSGGDGGTGCGAGATRVGELTTRTGMGVPWLAAGLLIALRRRRTKTQR